MDVERSLRNEIYRVRLNFRGLRSPLTIIVTTYLHVLGKFTLQTPFIYSALDIGLGYAKSAGKNKN